MPRSKNFRDYLIERLKDPKQASLYFDAILTECEDCDDEEEGRRRDKILSFRILSSMGTIII